MMANKHFLRMAFLYMVVNVTIKSCFSENIFFAGKRGSTGHRPDVSI